MEVWKGGGWAPYPDVDNVLRHGRRVTEAEALVHLNETRDRLGAGARFTDDEARAALRDRLKRA
jgi:hypothetical protein